MKQQIKAYANEVTGLIELFNGRIITKDEAKEMLENSLHFVLRRSGGEELSNLTNLVLKAERMFNS